MTKAGKDGQKRVTEEKLSVIREKLKCGIFTLPVAVASLLKVDLLSESVTASLASAFLKRLSSVFKPGREEKFPAHEQAFTRVLNSYSIGRKK